MSSQNDDSNHSAEQSINFAHLREKLKTDELPALREAGLLDEHVIGHLQSYKQHYEKNSGTHHATGEPAYWYYNTQYYTTVCERNISKNLRRAVDAGNVPTVQHASGIRDDQKASIDFVDYEKLRNIILEPGLLLLFSGGTGTGKTATSMRIIELVKAATQGDLQVATNIKSFAENYDWCTYVSDDIELKVWAATTDAAWKYAIIDEFSSVAGGSGAQGWQVKQKMHEFIRKARKEPYNLRILAIGHRVNDIAPTLRNNELAYYLRKEGDSKKQAQKNFRIYDSEAGDELYDDMVHISGVKDTSLHFDTNDTAKWDWVEDVEFNVNKGAIIGDYDASRVNNTVIDDDDNDEIPGSVSGETFCWNVVNEDNWTRCHAATDNDNQICDECRDEFDKDHWQEYAAPANTENEDGDANENKDNNT